MFNIHQIVLILNWANILFCQKKLGDSSVIKLFRNGWAYFSRSDI